MSLYRYSPISSEPESIRLLSLAPSPDPSAPIHCRLIHYSLLNDNGGDHLYEALSYTWGDPTQRDIIFVEGKRLNITTSLYTALQRLRNAHFERVIWADAVCINQDDLKERGSQIKYMAKIYAKASQVVVWLGEEADDSTIAFQHISLAADSTAPGLAGAEVNRQAVLALLGRPWFRRIWVLQEVATARQITVVCGSSRLSGSAFCSGLTSLSYVYEDNADLARVVSAVLYPIRGAVLRPPFTSLSDMRSLQMRPLGELLDMYHTREATERRDKIFALLGISSDDPAEAGLVPDYTISWEDLFHRFIQFVLGQEVEVQTSNTVEMAIIKCKGYIFGGVRSVQPDIVRNDRQILSVALRVSPMVRGKKRYWSAAWIVRASAKAVLPGDVLCSLAGAPSFIIIRPQNGYWSIINITASPDEDVELTAEGDLLAKRLLPGRLFEPRSFSPNYPYEIKPRGEQHDRPLTAVERKYKATLERDLVLIWDWARPAIKPTNLDEYYTILGSRHRKERRLSQARIVKALIDSGNHNGAEAWLRKSVEAGETSSGKGKAMSMPWTDCLALIHVAKEELQKAEDLVLQALRSVNLAQGTDVRDVLEVLQYLEWAYIDRGHFAELEALLDLRSVASRERTAKRIVQFYGRGVILLLLARGINIFKPQSSLLLAAARNERSGHDVMEFLLTNDKRNTPITETILRAVSENEHCGHRIMRVLLDNRFNDAIITAKVVQGYVITVFKKAPDMENHFVRARWEPANVTRQFVRAFAEKFGIAPMRRLLEEFGEFVTITPDVLDAVARNRHYAKEVMDLLLQHRPHDIKPTQTFLRHALGNEKHRAQMVKIFLEYSDPQIEISGSILEAAAWSHDPQEVVLDLLDQRTHPVRLTPYAVEALAFSCDHRVMRKLLDSFWEQVTITEEVIKAAANNEKSGQVLSLLLENCADDIRISEEVLKAVSLNSHCGEEMMVMLLEKRNKEVHVSDELLEIVAGYGQASLVRVVLLLKKGKNDLRIPEQMWLAAAKNRRRGTDIMKLFFEQPGAWLSLSQEAFEYAVDDDLDCITDIPDFFERYGRGIKVTNSVLKAAARKGDRERVAFLINQLGPDFKMSQELVVAAACNRSSRTEVLELFFEKWGQDIQITEDLIKTVIKEGVTSLRILKLLFEHCSIEAKSIEGLILEVAGSTMPGFEKEFEPLLQFLLLKRPKGFQITEEMLLTAAGRANGGDQIVSAFDKELAKEQDQGNRITERLLKVAASNRNSGYRIFDTLLMNYIFDISAEVIETAAATGQERLLDLIYSCGYSHIDAEEWRLVARLRAAAEGPMDDAETVRELINGKVPLDVVDSYGRSPLWAASKCGNKEIVKTLLATGAVDINKPDIDNRIPLFGAARSGHAEIVEVLLEHGADPSWVDGKGSTPASVAQSRMDTYYRDSRGPEKCFRILQNARNS